MRRRSHIPGAKTAALLAGAGIASFALILEYRDVSKPLSDALAPAVQALFAAIVAAFGITQMLIARDAMQAARRTVIATDEQTDVMRREVHRAEEDAAQRAAEAAEAIELARRQRRDAFAPKAVLIGGDATLNPPDKIDNDGIVTRQRKATFSTKEEKKTVLTLRVRLDLHNYGESPLAYRVEASRSEASPIPLRGIAMPGPNVIDVEWPEQAMHWPWLLKRSLPEERGADAVLFSVKVHVWEPHGIFEDCHTCNISLPAISENDSGSIVLAWDSVNLDLLAEIERQEWPGSV